MEKADPRIHHTRYYGMCMMVWKQTQTTNEQGRFPCFLGPPTKYTLDCLPLVDSTVSRQARIRAVAPFVGLRAMPAGAIWIDRCTAGKAMMPPFPFHPPGRLLQSMDPSPSPKSPPHDWQKLRQVILFALRPQRCNGAPPLGGPRPPFVSGFPSMDGLSRCLRTARPPLESFFSSWIVSAVARLGHTATGGS